MHDLDALLSRLEEMLAEIDALTEPVKELVFELLDGIDALHRLGLTRLADALDGATLDRLRSDAAVAWLLDAYGAGIDETAAADAALEHIRPYIHSHGGNVEILHAKGGIVHLRLSGACSGCTASSITLREGIEEALRDNFPAFVAIQVEEDHSPGHPPPGPTLLQIKGPSLEPPTR
ncbi:MAG: NifU family protein [Actinobacteria bacterium]|nr:NifU family protein [Actinomycetota bacterium]